MNYSPLIYAFKEKNIAITGKGKLDGCASNENWWTWKGFKEYGWMQGMPNQSNSGGRKSLFEMGEKGIPVTERIFGEGFYLRPQFIQPYQCENILIQGVEIVNSPMWIIHPVLSNNIVVKDVTIKSDGPNTDGIDPESCKDVLIKNCLISTGDDCIALKSGRNGDGRRINVPCENVIIQKCKMINGHGGVVIGSEISGGVRNIFAEDCTMDSPLLDRALRIKSSSARGGITENVYVRNIEVGQVKGEAIIITMFYEDRGAYMPTMRNIEVENMHVSKGGEVGIQMEGYRVSPIENIRFSNIKIENVKTPYRLENVKNIIVTNLMINGQAITESSLTVGNNERKPSF
jgi:polygalacturonase